MENSERQSKAQLEAAINALLGLLKEILNESLLHRYRLAVINNTVSSSAPPHTTPICYAPYTQ
jgi:hypothetical protein